MPRQDGRIEKGQSLRSAISARAWNRAQDAADVILGTQNVVLAGDAIPYRRAAILVRVRNDTLQTIPLFGVLGVSGVAINPASGTLQGTDAESSRARDFARQPVLTGVVPVLSQHRDSFVVCMEPIDAGKIGTAAVGGMFACRVNVTSATHKFATCKDGDATQLQSATCGIVQLVWKYTPGNPPALGQNIWCVGVM
jgi:hypothetical protein